MNTLSFMNIAAAYQTREVLHDVSLEIEPGQVLTLIGPNGSGKSTLIRVATGVIDATSGKIWIGDSDVLQMDALERARRIAVVPQKVKLPEAFTVLEVVLMGRTPHIPMWATETQTDHDVVLGAMRCTDVEHLADRPVGELSGGEQQRVVIARALAQEPLVLMLDEPTAHLDLRHQAAILDLIQALARDQCLAVLNIMHDLNYAARCSGLVALLADGTIHALGTPYQVLTAENLSAAYQLPVNIIAHPYYGTPLVVLNESPVNPGHAKSCELDPQAYRNTDD